jgi:hypothetical protein
MTEDKYINEYKVEPSMDGRWELYRKQVKPHDMWRYVGTSRYMWQVKRRITRLSTPTKYYQFGTV